MRNSQLRVSYTEKIQSAPILTSRDAYDFLMHIWDKPLLNIQEQVYMVYLNGCNEVISWRCMNTGKSNETLFDLKFSLSCALNCLAAKIIIAHNHSSGLLKPSVDDIAFTHKLNTAAQILDIELIDHIILAKKYYYSLKDNYVF